MPKLYIKVGFGVTSEGTFTEPGVTPVIGNGVWTQTITEKYYYGELTNPISRWSVSDKINEDLTVSTQISIVADAFANQNFHSIKYVEYLGTKWRATSVEVNRPRLIIQLGGEYNDG